MKKGKARKKPSASRRGPFFASHPINGVPFELRQRIASDYGKQQCEKFGSVLPQIIELVSQLDPLHTLALMSMYGLTEAPRQQTKRKKKAAWTPKVQQAHVEFLQAICLNNHLSRDTKFPDPQAIQSLFDWLPELFAAYQQMRIGTQPGSVTESTSSDKAGVVLVQEWLRAHTSVVRNWGYFGTVTRVSRQLFSRIDEEYERHAGMKLSKVVDIFEGLVRRLERRINEHRERIHGALSLHTKEAMLEKFFATFEFRGAVDDFRAGLASTKVTQEQAKWALLPLSDRFIGPTLLITNQEIADEFDLDVDAVAVLTNRISLAFADLANESPERFLLDNPVWLRPLVYLEKDHYFCALPQTLLSFVFPIVDELLVPFDGLQEKLSNAKASFLEDEVTRLFETAFPGCTKHRNFKWKEGSQQFESDLVVRFDTTLILVEAKSGRVSWPALRGAPDRLIEHIKRLIVEPSDQSGRLAQRLEEDISRLKRNESPTLDFPVPLDGITCVVRLSVMLYDFATVQSVPSMLEDAGVLKNKYPLAPCMSLADLEVMLDLLETPYLRLHYIRRRAELLMSLRTIGDELDMLGVYLDTAMNVDIGQDGQIITAGYSSKIDRYYSLLDEAISSKKPQPNTSQWLRRLCKQLEDRARPGWSEIACALLSISPNDQVTLESHVRKLAARVKAGKPLKAGFDTVVLMPSACSNQALALQVRRKDGPRPYSSHSEGIAQQTFASEHVKRCIVLVVDATDTDLGYLSAAMFTGQAATDVVYY